MDEMRNGRAGSSGYWRYYVWAMAGADAVAQAAPLAVAPPAPRVAPHLRDRKYDLGTRTYGNWSVSTTRTDPQGPIILVLDDVKTDDDERIVCVTPGIHSPDGPPPYSCVVAR